MEAYIVSTLAKASDKWLGNYSTKDKIKASGLWQVNELYNDALTLEMDRVQERWFTKKIGVVVSL